MNMIKLKTVTELTVLIGAGPNLNLVPHAPRSVMQNVGLCILTQETQVFYHEISVFSVVILECFDIAFC